MAYLKLSLSTHSYGLKTKIQEVFYMPQAKNNSIHSQG